MTASAPSEPQSRFAGIQTLSAAARRRLQAFIADPATPARQARRARIVLEAARGSSIRETAARIGISPATVELWSARFAEAGVQGLRDRPRPGRPRFDRRDDKAARASTQPGSTRRRRSAIGRTDATEPPAARPDSGVTVDSSGVGAAPTADATLEQLLRAASITIGERGIAATRVADIARQAGVSPATVHYYFTTRQQILIQALLWVNENATTGLEVFQPDAGDPLTRLAGLIERSIPYPGTQRDEYLLEIDLWSCIRLHPELLPAWERYHLQWIDGVTAIIEAGIADGTFSAPTQSARELAERLVALTDGLSDQSAIGARSMPATRVRTLVMNYVAGELGITIQDLESAANRPTVG